MVCRSSIALYRRSARRADVCIPVGRPMDGPLRLQPVYDLHLACCVPARRAASTRLEFSESLFGIHSTFDGSMILFEDVIQVLHGSVSTTIAQRIRQRDSSPPSQVADHFCACLQTEILVFS